jgi:acid phosphatase
MAMTCADSYGTDEWAFLTIRLQYEYENIISPFLYKLGNFTDKQSFGGDPAVAFLTNWTSPIDDPKSEIEKVTDTGKTDAAALGALIAQRYPDILTVNGTDPFRVWTGAATRDEDTAKAFVQGFNGSFSSIELVSVEEGEEQSANTLTPHVSHAAARL